MESEQEKTQIKNEQERGRKGEGHRAWGRGPARRSQIKTGRKGEGRV